MILNEKSDTLPYVNAPVSNVKRRDVFTIVELVIIIIALTMTWPIIVLCTNSTQTHYLATNDATQPVFYTFPLYMIKVQCANGQGPIEDVSDQDIENMVNTNNAIFVRSNAGFNWKADLITNITSSFCIQNINDNLRSQSLRNQVNATLDALHVSVPDTARIVLIAPMVKNSTSQTTGFAIIGDTFITIDPSEFKKPSNDLAHELGHTLNLTHPFNDEFTQVLDLPRICTLPKDRANQLAHCPTTLSSCNQGPEQLTNVMDYLPAHCASKYYFSPKQVDVMREYLKL